MKEELNLDSTTDPKVLTVGGRKYGLTPIGEKWWRADRGEYYYEEVPLDGVHREDGDEYDAQNHAQHNYFRIEADAKLHRRYVSAMMEALVCDGEWVLYAYRAAREKKVYDDIDFRFETQREAEEFYLLKKEHREMLKRHLV